MALAPGSRLGAYEILTLLGRGGMGEVYRARDTKLDREVAIKILPELFVSDPERVARFQREAKTLAALNHPHIGSIYGLEDAEGVRALVLELVEGPTLADRIAQGPIPLDEALPIAQQIAQALEAAHESAIIHRDLKPANIKLRPDGTVKVLDFGLAKALEPTAASSPNVTQSPTITTPAMMTSVGVILGTAAYMSPEQAKGRPADQRSDVWAFGCVLYEMLAGRRAFAGEDVSDTLAAILRGDPDWTALPTDVPEGVRRLLARALRKDRTQRLAHIADARLEIEDARTTRAPVEDARGRGSRWWEHAAWGGLVLVSIGLGWVSARQFSPAPGRREVRFEIETPTTVERQAIALSPDGTQLVFVANAAGQRRLLIRALGSTSTRVLERSDDARYPFWSADGKSIGFFAQGKLKALDISSGTVRSLAEAPRGLGGTWNQTGIIVFAPTFGGPLQQVSAAGGPISPASRMSRSVVRQASPRFLPDGKHFLFYADGDDQERGVYVGQLDSMDATRVVTDADAAAVFLPPHALVYPRAGALVARHFDPIDRRVSGEPIQIAESVYFDPLQSASALSAATDGTLAFRPRSDAGLGVRLSWFDRSGREIERADSRTDAAANAFALSPDRQRVAIGRSQQRGIWLLDIARGIVEPFVRFGNQPVWARDGKRLAFAASKTSRFLDLYVASLDGNGSDELLLSTPQTKTASDWSPDGASLLFRSIDPVTRSDLWMLPLSGNRTPVLVLKTDADERDAMFSPDGRWIAYESDRTGRPEISLQPFGRPGPTMQISSGGGLQARWRGDGRELFYVREDDGRLMAVAVDNLASDNPVAHPPTALFTAPLAIGGPGLQQYTASPDGQRFLINVIRDRAAEAITVILNWQEELKQRVPTR